MDDGRACHVLMLRDGRDGRDQDSDVPAKLSFVGKLTFYQNKICDRGVFPRKTSGRDHYFVGKPPTVHFFSASYSITQIPLLSLSSSALSFFIFPLDLSPLSIDPYSIDLSCHYLPHCLVFYSIVQQQ
jgi:hypothetical protein